MNAKHVLFATAVVTFAVVGLPTDASATDYHHMHLTAPDAKVAAAWYIEHMGCEDFGREGACRVGTTDFYWFEREPQAGSVGSGGAAFESGSGASDSSGINGKGIIKNGPAKSLSVISQPLRRNKSCASCNGVGASPRTAVLTVLE